MSKQSERKDSQSIRSYFRTRAASKVRELEKKSVASDCEEMATGGDITMADLYILMKGLDDKVEKMDEKVSTGLTEISDSVRKMNEKVESLEFEVEDLKKTQKEDSHVIANLREEVKELRYSLLTAQAYSRKYHLLLYGVEGHEHSVKETIARVRKFACESLKLDPEFVEKMTIRNAHRLQKHGDALATIVVVFLFWSERDAVLRAGPNLKGTRMSVRTDLPPSLKKKRNELATLAYELRRDEKIQTRIREKGADIWLETRPSSSCTWTKKL